MSVVATNVYLSLPQLLICICLICIETAHAPVWQGVGLHEVKKSTSSCIRAKTKLKDQLPETSRDFDTKQI